MSNPGPSLVDLQRWMRWILTDSRGVEGALSDSHPAVETLSERDRRISERFTSPSPDCREWVMEMPPLSREARLSIYAEGYFLRLLDSLRQDFPRTARLLGEEIFRAVILEYTDKFPSRSYTLGELGRNLASFISEHPIRNFSPVLVDLVHFEWKENEAFWSRRQMPITEARLAEKLSLPQVERLRVELNDTVTPLKSPWPLEKLWDQDSPEDPKSFSAGEHFFVLHRPALQVRMESISSLEYQLLARAKQGISIGSLFEECAEATAAEVQTIFAHWTKSGWITDLPDTGEAPRGS